MTQLKTLTNEFLAVYETPKGEKVVDARELHKQLLVGKDFTTWMKQLIDKYGFISNEDYFLTLTKIGERRNITRHDYILTLDTAKEIAMVQNNEQGRVIRKYFIEVEKRFRQGNMVQNYLSMSEEDRAIAYFNSLKEKKLMEQQRQEELPYTNFGKAVSNSNAEINIGAFSKLMYDDHGIKLGRNKMFVWLRENGYLIRSGRERNQPKQQYIEQGLFTTTVTMVSRTEGDVESVTTLITGKGQVAISQKLLQEFKVTT